MNTLLKQLLIVLILITQAHAAMAGLRDPSGSEMNEENPEEAQGYPYSPFRLNAPFVPFVLQDFSQAPEPLPAAGPAGWKPGKPAPGMPFSGLVDLFDDDSLPFAASVSENPAVAPKKPPLINDMISWCTSRLPAREVGLSDYRRFYALAPQHSFKMTQKLNAYIKELIENDPSEVDAPHPEEDRLEQISSFFYNHWVGEKDIPKVLFLTPADLDLLRTAYKKR
jgi:hypothetical protein